MYAIVLTYDERAPFVDLLLKQYNALWPQCPLIFRIPYNNQLPYWKSSLDIQHVKTGKSIGETIDGLLRGIPNNEPVYWCMDDTYPIRIFKYEILNALIGYTFPKSVDAIRLMISECDIYNTKNKIIINGYEFWLRTPFMFRWFWSHHIVRARYIRQLLVASHVKNIWEVSSILRNFPSFNHNIYMPHANILTCGETTRSKHAGINGQFITSNCAYDMKRLSISPPTDYKMINLSVYNNHRFNGSYILGNYE